MLRIIFMDPPSTVQNWMLDDDGQVSLDLNEKTTVALTKIIDDYIEAGTIKQDNFNEFTIPITKKNRILFGPVGNPSALNVNNTKVFMIQLIADSVSYPATGLEIVEANDKEKQYSCTIFGEINDWYRPLSQMRLNDLDLGSDIVDFNFIIDQNANSIYNENLAPVVAPLVNYGKWFINTNKPIYSEVPAQVVFNNLRFWFHPYALVKQALCQVGYKLIAPYFDTEAKRKHWSYLLDPDFETANQLDVANRSFLVNPNATIFFNVLFETRASGAQYNGVFFRVGATSDPGNHYFTRVAGGSFPLQDYYGSFYSGGMIGTFSFIGTVNLTPTNAPNSIIPIAPTFINLRISIKKAPKFGILGQDVLLNNATTLATKEYVYKSPIINGVSLDFDFNLVTDRIKVYQHEVVFVHVEYKAELTESTGIGGILDESFLIDDTVILPGLEFKNNVELQVIEEGDTIEFGKLLRKDKSPIELIAGLAHLDDLKLESDVINKTISMYPEFKVDLGGTDGVQEGFFLENTNNAFEATPKIHANSAVQRFRNQDLGRNVYLKFKDSTDGYIQSLNLEDEPHSKKVDLGDQYKEQENKIENPFFEPTLNAFDSRISGYVVQLGTNPVQTSGNYLPFMWESAPTGDNYPDVGFDYQPRIATMQANGGQIVVLEPSITGYDTNSESIYVYEDNITFFQLIFGQIFPDAVKRKGGSNLFPLTDTIVYGNDFVNTALLDQYQLIYQRAIKQAYFGVVLEFLVDIDLLDFANLSFRRKWHIKYYSGAWGEIDFYARISRVTDYVFGANILTPVEVIADNNNFICE